jgi:NNP family nitrate/nitrite transporter-like MFS transporter
MDNAAALYFKDQFGLNTEAAGAVASIFGWMLLFSRAMGGYISDKANGRWGMRGRLWVQAIALLGEGIMIFIFAHTKTLGGSIVVMVVFSLFCQGATGTTYGVRAYLPN